MTAVLRAVLLDVDGTLIDSNHEHARAWVEAFGEFGHDVPFERVRRLIGKGGDKIMPAVIGVDSDSPDGKRIDQRRTELFRERYLPQLKPFPAAKQLLERMRDEGLRLVVATSAKEEEMDALLEICGASELVTGRASGDAAQDSKPDGDIVAAALAQASVGAGEALMLGDTPYDIEAARRVGVNTVALRSGGWDDASLAGAVAVYADARELLERYGESPFAR